MYKIMLTIFIWVVFSTFFYFAGCSPINITDVKYEVRAPAFFTHDRHMEELDCMQCHHKFENGKNVLEEDELDGGDAMRCVTCHNSKSSVNARDAYHHQCIGCHRDYKKKKKAFGPITCGECHPQKIPEDTATLIIER